MDRCTPDTPRESDSALGQSNMSLEPLAGDAFTAVATFFQYDKGIPLNTDVLAKSETEGYTREKIVFTGGRGDRVPGILAIPKTGTGPYPLVLEIHAGASSKEGWWVDSSYERGQRLTECLLAKGMAVLALDAQYHGERSANNDYLSLREMYFERKWFARYRDMLVESTRDYFRALDYLSARPEVDLARVGTIGYSMGAIMAIYLTALEPKIRATVACVAALSDAWLYPLSPLNFGAAIRHRPVLLLAGRTDSLISVESSQRLFDLLGTSSELALFDSGHQLPIEYVDRAFGWFEPHLR